MKEANRLNRFQRWSLRCPWRFDSECGWAAACRRWIRHFTGGSTANTNSRGGCVQPKRQGRVGAAARKRPASRL